MKPMTHLVRGMKGLGDNIYQRPHVRALGGTVYLETPWPELYADMPHVKPVRSHTTLRTQAKNEQRSKATWHEPPAVVHRTINVSYGVPQLAKMSVPAAVAACFGHPELRLDLPPLPSHLPDVPAFLKPELPRPYAVVRPVTVRTEWRNEARNPDPVAVAACARLLVDRGYHVVSVADLAQPKQEWALEPIPQAHVTYHRGELTALQVLGLMANADLILGGVGFLVPTAFAAGVPFVGVLGGQGKHNAPEVITPKPHLNHPALWLYPNGYCRCDQMLHRCPKEIPDAAEQLSRWLDATPARVAMAA